ncbi:MAG TPA: cupin-like domain-containing protein [Usitatibacter sp.]|jgi:hypothetical protein|nr:cupin-like domain-containing protein [Usitatibacter sp.]
MKPLAETGALDAQRFREAVAPAGRPAVMRGVVREWPAVRAARAAPDGILDYLRALDNGAKVTTLRMPPSVNGRIFYNAGLEGFNYTRDPATLTSVLERMARYAALARPASIVVQSAPLADCLPGFAAQNANPLLDAAVAGRIWLGNRVVTPAHFDESSNVAFVVAGRRRFTLFPPEAIGDLYIGPIGYAPTGTPVSLVDFDAPDPVRFPRFARALEAAQVADLEPGDGIYIPPLWWHHVRSLDAFNVLVNYWWKDRPAASGTDSALNALLLALLDLRGLPLEQRRAWGAIFEHYVFGADASTASHIPEAKRGVLGEASPELARQVRAFLAAKLRD